MAIELISCPACGAKNASHRRVCLSCGANLPAALLPGREDKQKTELTREFLLEWVKRCARSWNTIRLMQLGFISAVLLVALSIFYYLVIFSPKREEARKKEEEQRLTLQREQTETSQMVEAARLALEVVKEQVKQQEKSDAEAKATLNEVLLEECLSDAYRAYTAQWAEASQMEAERKVAQTRRGQVTVAVTCIQLRLDPSICRSALETLAREGQATSKYSSTSPLPILVADSLNNDLYRRKDECYKRYPQR